MGLFDKKEFKKIDPNGRMIQRFPTFHEYFEYNRDLVNAELSQSDNNTIEFRLPILTFGNIMGQIYMGIHEESEIASMFIYAVSRRGKKTKRYKTTVSAEYTMEEMDESGKILTSKIIIDSDFRRISTGG